MHDLLSFAHSFVFVSIYIAGVDAFGPTSGVELFVVWSVAARKNEETILVPLAVPCGLFLIAAIVGFCILQVREGAGLPVVTLPEQLPSDEY